LVRAEAEAVAALRDALVAGALAERDGRHRQPAHPRPTATEHPPPESGDLLWSYGVLHATEPTPDGLAGVDRSGSVERVEAAGLAALVSAVPRAEFAEEPLRRSLNELTWLARVARAHEDVLEQALAATTIVPLRLCTLYDSRDAVQRMLERERDTFADALNFLAGRQEWGVKLLVEPERLAQQARGRSDQAAALENESEPRGGGGAYLMRRRLEREVRDHAATLAAEVADEVHARLEDWAIDAVKRPPQNRDLSGHDGEMLLNAAYLVEADRVGELRELAAELEARHRAVGARIEVTGPWPPYNFVPSGGAAGLP
jgi:hypothetical protein